MADHQKLPGAVFNVAQQRPAGWSPGMADHQKLPGAIFNVAQRRPAGGSPGMADHQNCQEQFL